MVIYLVINKVIKTQGYWSYCNTYVLVATTSLVLAYSVSVCQLFNADLIQGRHLDISIQHNDA